MPPNPTTTGPPLRQYRRHRLFWPALLVAVAVGVGGVVVAATGYATTRGPGGAVRGYFEALERSDAPAALAFGDVPSGPRTMLTPAVLREQQRLAPIVDLRIGTVRRTSERAQVTVGYALRYPHAVRAVSVRIGVHDSDDGWRLDAVAVRTRLMLSAATQRASVLGRKLPSGQVLTFPGALPVRLDTTYLALDPDDGVVPGVANGVHSIITTDAALAAMQDAVLAAVRRCLVRPTTSCPLPTERYLPGSVRGSLHGPPTDVSVSLNPTEVGLLEFSANVPVLATSYQRLDFENRVSTGRGPLTLVVHAVAAAHAPLSISWLTV